MAAAHPAETQVELAYLGIEVRDVDGLAAVLGDIVGLMPGEPTADGARTWRDDARAHRLLVTEGASDDAAVVGFQLPSNEALDAAVARLRSLGHAVDEGGADDARARRVERLVRTSSPWGTAVELVVGLAAAATPFTSALVPGGFLTEGVGFGHLVFVVADPDAAHRFVVDGLGFRQTDWLELSPVPGLTIVGRFYHGNPRHHSLALIAMPEAPPQKMHHVMFETNDYDAVGSAFDRAFESGIAIANGLGRHDNDRMFSFYVVTPAGFQIEVGHGARVVTGDWEASGQNHAYDRISAWGHQPVTRG